MRYSGLLALALAAPLLGACSSQNRAQTPVQTMPGEQAQLPGSQASELGQGFDPTLLQSIDPEFRRSVADYSIQVRRLRSTNFAPDQQAIGYRTSVDLLANAIAAVPNVDKQNIGQAAQMIHMYVAPSRLAAASPEQQMMGSIDGMRAASSILLQLANGPFQGAPEVQQHAMQVYQAVMPQPGQRYLQNPQQSLELASRQAAATLQAMEMALARGEVTP
jgi:hypothetical protein